MPNVVVAGSASALVHLPAIFDAAMPEVCPVANIAEQLRVNKVF